MSLVTVANRALAVRLVKVDPQPHGSVCRPSPANVASEELVIQETIGPGIWAVARMLTTPWKARTSSSMYPAMSALFMCCRRKPDGRHLPSPARKKAAANGSSSRAAPSFASAAARASFLGKSSSSWAVSRDGGWGPRFLPQGALAIVRTGMRSLRICMRYPHVGGAVETPTLWEPVGVWADLEEAYVSFCGWRSAVAETVEDVAAQGAPLVPHGRGQSKSKVKEVGPPLSQAAALGTW